MTFLASTSSAGPAPAAGGATPADLIKDVTLASFVADVIEASRKQPVIVDFWAPWCGPCKQLGPVLEKLVLAYKGTVRLVKIDIDRDPQIAQQMGVQSIPAVFAFFNGQPIDGFMGALPESQVKQWIDRLIKATGAQATDDESVGLTTALKQAADFFAAGEVDTAHSIYADIFSVVPENAEAFAGVLRCLIAQGHLEQARKLLDGATPELTKDKALEQVRTALELAEQAGNAGSDERAALEAKLQQDPNDHQARFDLAMAHYAANDRTGAVDQLLEIVRRNRGWNEEAARKQLVKFFEAFGQMDPVTVDARKRLSSILFS